MGFVQQGDEVQPRELVKSQWTFITLFPCLSDTIEGITMGGVQSCRREGHIEVLEAERLCLSYLLTGKEEERTSMEHAP